MNSLNAVNSSNAMSSAKAMNSSKLEKSSGKLPWLAGLFALQVVAAVVLLNVQSRERTVVNEPLLAFDAAEVDRLEIAGPEETVQLQKKNNRWQLGEDLPVAQNRVSDLLTQIEGLHGNWPVATTADAAERFEVSDEKFKRKIRLLNGDKELATLYLGTSPSFKQSHVRAAGAENIYAVKLDEFALPTEQDSWLDTSLLRPQGEIVALQAGGQKVSKTDGKWPSETATAETAAAPQAAGTAAAPAQENPVAAADGAPAASGTAPDTAGQSGKPVFDSAAFARALADVTVLGLAKNQADFDAPTTGDPAAKEDSQLLKLEWTVTTNEGNYQYQLLNNKDQYFIRRNDNEHTFRVSKAQYDALVKIQELQQIANS